MKDPAELYVSEILKESYRKNVLPEYISKETYDEKNYKYFNIKTVDFNYVTNQYGFRSEEFSTFDLKNIKNKRLDVIILEKIAE